MMTHCVVAAVVCSVWLLPVILTAYSIVKVDGLVEVPEYGTCMCNRGKGDY